MNAGSLGGKGVKVLKVLKADVQLRAEVCIIYNQFHSNQILHDHRFYTIDYSNLKSTEIGV